MQFAINIFIFVFGFGLASLVGAKPKQLRASLDSLMTNLRYVLDAFRPGAASTTEQFEKHLVAQESPELLTRSQVESRFSEDTWQREAYDSITEIVMGKGGRAKYPCVFATNGLHHNQHRWLFMPSADTSEPRNIRLVAAALRAYLPSARSIGANTSLLIVHPPEKVDRTVADYQAAFWALLRGLRTADLKPWPTDVPSETASPKWAFCFDGQPAFLAAMTPAHEARASRNAPNFTVAVQPKWVFDELFATPEKRRSAVEKVRKLMPAYDSIAPSPDLSAYGQEGTTESHQYYLLDKNETAECPYVDMDK